jgi:hypothetical protein
MNDKNKSNNYAFIDGQNLTAGLRGMGWKLDQKKFRVYLEEELGVSKAYIFVGFMEEHQDLYTALQDVGFIMYFKPMVRYDDGTVKGNVDADMVLHTMIEVQKYDKAVIVSGDGDFAGLIRHLASVNKLRQVIVPNKEKYSSLFKRLDGFDDNKFTYMNDLRGQLAYRDGRRPYSRSKKTPPKPIKK